MRHDVLEEKISIGYYGEETTNYLDFAIQIIDADNISTPKVLKVDKHIQWIACGICWAFLFVGTYFRYFLYSFLFGSYKSKEFKPIDTLILIISLVQHINIVLFVTKLTLLFSYDVNLDQISAQPFCTTVEIVFEFDLVYSCIGSLGISIFRILYIKHDEWLKYDFGENKYMYITLFVGLILATILVTSFHINPYSQMQRENCMTPPQMRRVIGWLEEYKESQGQDSTAPLWNFMATVVFLILIVMTLAEITTYCVYFHYIYRHDNSERLKRLLEPAVIRNRNKRNAITFFGQFCSFVFDITINICIVIMTVAFGDNYMLEYYWRLFAVIFVMKPASFTAMSMVEVLTSTNLRSRMKLPFKSKN